MYSVSHALSVSNNNNNLQSNIQIASLMLKWVAQQCYMYYMLCINNVIYNS